MAQIMKSEILYPCLLTSGDEALFDAGYGLSLKSTWPQVKGALDSCLPTRVGRGLERAEKNLKICSGYVKLFGSVISFGT
ncbi:MAG: hypothetical protein ACLPYB_13910 [Desulfobaccales bacterium]